MDKLIVTGCPGSGKSTLINALAKEDVRCFDEVARPLIIQYQKKMHAHWPWQNMKWYAPRMAAKMRSQMRIADYEKPPVCFFDRGLPDLLAYFQWQGIETYDWIRSMCLTLGYSKKVVLLPPWKEIYRNDPQRPQSYLDACVLHRHLLEVYEDLGFEVHILPKVHIPERLRWLKEWLKSF